MKQSDQENGVHPDASFSSSSTKLHYRCANLLDLPGEIRNIIYTHTLDDMCKQEPLLRFRRRPEQHHPRNGRIRSYLGLTQACRQLRQEYRPLHQSRAELHVDTQVLDAFIQDWYPDGIGVSTLGTLTAGVATAVHAWDYGRFDLLELVRAEQWTPGLHFVSETELEHMRNAASELNSFLARYSTLADSQDRGEWLEFLDGLEAAQIHVRHGAQGGPSIYVALRLDREAGPMIQGEILLGLYGLKHWKIVLHWVRM